MSNVCELTGKKRLRGNRVSHANNKTTHYQQPNLRVQRIYVPELKSMVSVKVSTKGLRTIDKYGGLSRYLVKTDAKKLSPNMLKLKKLILKKGLI